MAFLSSRRPVVLPPIIYRESPNQSPRNAPVTLIVVHDTEGNYDGAVQWLRSRTANASAHVVLREDGGEATQLVAYGRKAWHCVTYNRQSIGLELAGLARVGYRDVQLRRAARVVAFFLHKYGLPARHVTPGRDGRVGRGWTLHQDLGALGGGHHDPGFSRAKAWWFGLLVRAELRRGGFLAVWGHDQAPT